MINLRHIINIYAEDDSDLISKQNQTNDINQNNTDKNFVKKMKQLSEFNIDGQDSLDEDIQEPLDFTPKYNMK